MRVVAGPSLLVDSLWHILPRHYTCCYFCLESSYTLLLLSSLHDLVLLSAAAVILLRFCCLASGSDAGDCQSAVGRTQTYISCFYGDIGASFRLMFKVNILLSFQFMQQKRKKFTEKGHLVGSPCPLWYYNTKYSLYFFGFVYGYESLHLLSHHNNLITSIITSIGMFFRLF